jgi:uncharacterized protein (UPF0305 family)
VENQENKHSIAHPSRMMISTSTESQEVWKEHLREELKNELLEILAKELQEKLNEIIQKQLKEYQENTTKKLEKTQEQLNELRRTSTNSKMKLRRL